VLSEDKKRYNADLGDYQQITYSNQNISQSNSQREVRSVLSNTKQKTSIEITSGLSRKTDLRSNY
jgi:hypothetical protein